MPLFVIHLLMWPLKSGNLHIVWCSVFSCYLVVYNVPDKRIKLIKLTIQRTKVKVKVNNSYSEWFATKTGVRQGDPLSAPLFSVVLDLVITNLEIRGNITTRLKQICAYADDTVINGRTKQILIDTFCKLKHEALKAGLIVNNNKIKYLYCTRKNHPA